MNGQELKKNKIHSDNTLIKFLLVRAFELQIKKITLFLCFSQICSHEHAGLVCNLKIREIVTVNKQEQICVNPKSWPVSFKPIHHNRAIKTIFVQTLHNFLSIGGHKLVLVSKFLNISPSKSTYQGCHHSSWKHLNLVSQLFSPLICPGHMIVNDTPSIEFSLEYVF